MVPGAEAELVANLYCCTEYVARVSARAFSTTHDGSLAFFLASKRALPAELKSRRGCVEITGSAIVSAAPNDMIPTATAKMTCWTLRFISPLLTQREIRQLVGKLQ